VLRLNGLAAKFDLNTPLLGALPELDSMAVVWLFQHARGTVWFCS
jgi:hypothetical protein